MKNRTMLRTLFLALATVVAVTAAATGQEEVEEQKKSALYQWTDENGIVHITDNPGKIPEGYRSRAQKIEVPEEKETGEQYDRNAPERNTSRESGMDEAEEDIRKAEWRDRIADWKARLAEAERRYRELETERSGLFIQWGGVPAYAPAEIRLKGEQLDREMTEVRQKIDEARHMIDEVIPEEARKAGIPPGWLRE